ncbi:maestro heat-like repeat family member 5, partial [Empidonax traillii]|uniref:maestro heat-like repeat family member 5 n=1 Tax=Empidonax traillii TaxID=164674 RepID=UPI000FFD2306
MESAASPTCLPLSALSQPQLPGMVLDYLDGRKCRESVLPILSRNLQSQCPDRRRLALRGLLVLSVDPSMADSICSLAESLLELLHHEDTELVEMTLSVFLNVLRIGDLQAFSCDAPQLAETLQPLFENDNSHVQLLSICLFQEVMEMVAKEGKTDVCQGLLPFFHWDDEKECGAEATLALWHIIQEPECEEAMISHAPHLLLSLLFQISMSTEQMSEEVNAFWRQCQEEHGLPNNPSRFAVQTLKALLCRLHWENEVVAIERKRGWETLLCSDTHHYAVGLLAREMRHVLVPFHCEMAIHLLGLLSREEPHWELPALAFLVEILDYLDGRKCHDTVLPILSRNLQSQCPERQRLALRGLLVLSVDPSMAESICSLAENLLELLRHEDVEMVEMTLSVFLNMLQDEDLQAFGSAALKLAEALQPLFDNDNSHVQLLSIRLFREVMELVVEEGKETLVHQSLVPLLFHCHDETQCVAEASRETLLCAASLLKRRDLEQLLRKKQHLEFCDCLMDKDMSRRDEHLRQALTYLQSPQQPLRELAVRFM